MFRRSEAMLDLLNNIEYRGKGETRPREDDLPGGEDEDDENATDTRDEEGSGRKRQSTTDGKQVRIFHRPPPKDTNPNPILNPFQVLWPQELELRFYTNDMKQSMVKNRKIVEESRFSVSTVVMGCLGNLDCSKRSGEEEEEKQMFLEMIRNWRVVSIKRMFGNGFVAAMNPLPIPDCYNRGFQRRSEADFTSEDIDQDLLHALITNIINGGIEIFKRHYPLGISVPLTCQNLILELFMKLGYNGTREGDHYRISLGEEPLLNVYTYSSSIKIVLRYEAALAVTQKPPLAPRAEEMDMGEADAQQVASEHVAPAVAPAPASEPELQNDTVYINANSEHELMESFNSNDGTCTSSGCPVVFLRFRDHSRNAHHNVLVVRHRDNFLHMIQSWKVVRLTRESVSGEDFSSLPISFANQFADFNSEKIDPDLLEALITNIISGGIETFKRYYALGISVPSLMYGFIRTLFKQLNYVFQTDEDYDCIYYLEDFPLFPPFHVSTNLRNVNIRLLSPKQRRDWKEKLAAQQVAPAQVAPAQVAPAVAPAAASAHVAPKHILQPPAQVAPAHVAPAVETVFYLPDIKNPATRIIVTVPNGFPAEYPIENLGKGVEKQETVMVKYGNEQFPVSTLHLRLISPNLKKRKPDED